MTKLNYALACLYQAKTEDEKLYANACFEMAICEELPSRMYYLECLDILYKTINRFQSVEFRHKLEQHLPTRSTLAEDLIKIKRLEEIAAQKSVSKHVKSWISFTYPDLQNYY